MIARALAKVLENRKENDITANTWTFLALQKRYTLYPNSHFTSLERTPSVNKGLSLLANQSSTFNSAIF